jgi:polysaccharide pyruvyl transferase WcaK-like protein
MTAQGRIFLIPLRKTRMDRIRWRVCVNAVRVRATQKDNQMLADVDMLDQQVRQSREDVVLSERPSRIGIWGHYGGANQGDELVVATLIANIRARLPDAEIVGFCVNPADTRQRHGIRAFPLRASARGGQPEKPWSAADLQRTPSQTDERCTGSGLRAFLKQSRPLVSLVHWLRRKRRTAASICREIASVVSDYRNLRGTDMLIVAGSGSLIDDWGGPWAHPYALLKWSVLARLCGTRLVCLSAGAGPIGSRVSRAFLRRALRTTWYRSYRDPSSARLIAGLGVEGEHPVVPDMGFGLDVSSYVRPWDVPPAARNRTIVGLGVMAHRRPRYMPRDDRVRYEAYIHKIAAFTAWLLAHDYAVLAVPTDIRFDPQAFADVRDLLRRGHGFQDDPRLIEQPVDGLSALISRMAACDYVIHARYHGIVLPCLLGKPVVSLAYNRKHFDLMRMMGQEEYCLDIDRFQVADLVERFQMLVRNRDAVCAVLPQRVAGCQANVAEQYDRVLGPPLAAKQVPRPLPEAVAAR